MGVPNWQRVPIVSGRTARRILDSPPGGLRVSLDLGRSETELRIERDAVVLPDGSRIGRDDLERAFSDLEDCIRLDGGCRKVYSYSESERKYYKLFQPFENLAPTIVINGATMHAIVGTDPWSDAEQKVASVPMRGGRCLDTCCGLGYSAQLLSARFDAVTTCEVDANVLDIAAVNPWSEGLFCAPSITVRNEDMRRVLAGSAPGSLQCIFHDPPTVYQAGELYAEALYRRFARVLAPGGALYHYVGEPGKYLGRDYAGGVMQGAGALGLREQVFQCDAGQEFMDLAVRLPPQAVDGTVAGDLLQLRPAPTGRRALDSFDDFGHVDPCGPPDQPVAAGRAARAVDERSALQIQQDVDQVLWRHGGAGCDLPHFDRRLAVVVPGQVGCGPQGVAHSGLELGHGVVCAPRFSWRGCAPGRRR